MSRGETVDLRFRINNPTAGSATGITFTDNLPEALAGLTAVGLPTDPCGPGSTLAGTTVLTLAGGRLGPGESCRFTVGLLVPAAAAFGSFTNTTSPLTSSLGQSPPAADDVSVSPVNFYPFSHKGGDLATFEVSDLDVYNFEFRNNNVS